MFKHGAHREASLLTEGVLIYPLYTRISSSKGDTVPSRNETEKSIINSAGQFWAAIRLLQPDSIISLDLTLPQLKVLTVLKNSGQSRMTDLAGKLGVSLPTATGLVDRLIDKDCVVRTTYHGDRRVVLCDLSPKGREIATSMNDLRAKSWHALFEQMDDQELAIVEEVFRLLRQRVQQVPILQEVATHA